jgi:hypothetical protein
VSDPRFSKEHPVAVLQPRAWYLVPEDAEATRWRLTTFRPASGPYRVVEQGVIREDRPPGHRIQGQA